MSMAPSSADSVHGMCRWCKQQPCICALMNEVNEILEVEYSGWDRFLEQQKRSDHERPYYREPEPEEEDARDDQ